MGSAELRLSRAVSAAAPSMSIRSLLVTTATGLAFLIGGFSPVTFDLLGSQPSLAKSDNAGGNGNGRSEERGGGKSDDDDDRGRANSASDEEDHPGRSGDAPGHNKPSDPEPESAVQTSASTANGRANAPGQNKPDETASDSALASIATPTLLNGEFEMPSDKDLAILHAARANIQAWINSNGVPHLIAVAVGAKLDEATAEEARNLAQEAFDIAEAELTTATEGYDAAIGELTGVYMYVDVSPAALQLARDALVATDTTTFAPEQLEAYNAEIAAIDATLAAAMSVETAQTAYNTADGALMTAETDLADAVLATSDALNAAATPSRRPVVDENIMNWLLMMAEQNGMLDYYMDQQDEQLIVVE